MRTSLLVLFLAACSPSAPPSDGSRIMATPPPPTPEPSATQARAEAGAPVAMAPATKDCVPPMWRESGRITSHALVGDRIEACFEAQHREKPHRECFAVALKNGVYQHIDGPSDALSAKPKTRVETGDGKMTMCRDNQCTTIKLAGWAKTTSDAAERPQHVLDRPPAAMAEDGMTALVVRHDPKGIFLETYDVDSGKRKTRVQLDAQLVDRVYFTHKRALVPDCVTAGPGCTLRIVDPAAHAKIKPDQGMTGINVYGVSEPVHHVKDGEHAVVHAGGTAVTWLSLPSGKKVHELEIKDAADVEHGAEALRDGDELYVVLGAPHTGDVVRIDVGARTITKRFAAPVCKP